MAAQARPTRYCKRVIACMDVRANDAGDLVCTKGDQYDVREKAETAGEVRLSATGYHGSREHRCGYPHPTDQSRDHRYRSERERERTFPTRV